MKRKSTARYPTLQENDICSKCGGQIEKDYYSYDKMCRKCKNISVREYQKKCSKKALTLKNTVRNLLELNELLASKHLDFCIDIKADKKRDAAIITRRQNLGRSVFIEKAFEICKNACELEFLRITPKGSIKIDSEFVQNVMDFGFIWTYFNLMERLDDEDFKGLNL